MKNKTLIVAGLGVAALAAFLIYRNQKKSTNSNNGSKTTDGEGSSGTPSSSLPSAESKAPSKTTKPFVLRTKKVLTAQDLIGTPFGTFISVELATDDAKKKINEVIKSLTNSEKIILEHIVLYTDEIRDSEAFDNALVAKYGKKATKIKAQVIERMGAASRFKGVSTTTSGTNIVGKVADAISNIFGGNAEQAVDRIQENMQTRRNCRSEARSRGLRGRAKRQFIRTCKQQGGFDDGSEDFAFGFTSDKLSAENEIFAFNGHTF